MGGDETELGNAKQARHVAHDLDQNLDTPKWRVAAVLVLSK
jgi:hypothetical protein